MPELGQHNTITGDTDTATKASAEEIAINAAKSALFEKTSVELSKEVSNLLQNNIFISEVPDEESYEDAEGASDAQDSDSEDNSPTNGTEELDFASGRLQDDSPTNGTEEGLDDNTPADNPNNTHNDFETEFSGNARSIQKENQSVDMYTSLQKQAYSNHYGRISNESFSILLILICNLDELGFLPKVIDEKDVLDLQHDNVFISEIQNIDYQYVINNLQEINDCICFKQHIDQVKFEVRQAFNALWSLKPTGIGSRDMMEYHITLSKMIENYPDWATAMIKNNHNLIMEKKFEDLSNITNMPIAEIKTVLEMLGKFRPYPSDYFRPDAAYCIPELRIIPNTTGNYKATFTREGAIKPIAFNRTYLNSCVHRQANFDELELLTSKELLQNQTEISEDISMIEENQVREDAVKAVAFIQNLSERQYLLKKAAEYIIEQQKRFLESGNNIYLKPMQQKDLCEVLDTDATRISRLLKNKYVEIVTENGTLVKELQWFFAKKDNSAIVDQIIRAEDPANPLSDFAIMEILREEYGIEISQPTTVRLRRTLGYPNFEQRRITT